MVTVRFEFFISLTKNDRRGRDWDDENSGDTVGFVLTNGEPIPRNAMAAESPAAINCCILLSESLLKFEIDIAYPFHHFIYSSQT